MTREEAINEINKVFTSAYANYIVTALTEGATVSDIQHRWGRAYEAGVKDGLEQKPCEDAVSRQAVIDMTGLSEWFDSSDSYNEFVIALSELPPVTPQEPRWIPVTEKLPEEKTAVLLSCDDMYLAKLNPCIGWISGNNWYTFSARGSYLVKYPIAWMPLPEPYKAESEKT